MCAVNVSRKHTSIAFIQHTMGLEHTIMCTLLLCFFVPITSFIKYIFNSHVTFDGHAVFAALVKSERKSKPVLNNCLFIHGALYRFTPSIIVLSVSKK